jgi:transporter family-2 protein
MAKDKALPAVIVSSSLGVILLIAVTLSARTPWPSLSSLAGRPWWGWLGGALGAVYAVATVLLARELGAAPLTALVVTGQLVCSVRVRPFRLGRLHRAHGGPWAYRGLCSDGGRVLLDRALLRNAGYSTR